MMRDIEEMHAMIADAVKEGILAAYKEMGGTTEDTTYENAKAYCERLKIQFTKHARRSNIVDIISDSLELVHEMRRVLTENECKYVVTHIHAFVGIELSTQANEFVHAYLI